MLTTRVFRLFVSSTFSDFIAEREALQKEVFPELEKYCAERGARFQAVDLRWGITEEAQREHDTMRICLEEIRRCQQLSPRPNFAVLLGDRYGWEPPPARIPVDHWERLVTAASREDCSCICDGYMGPDLNAVPPAYHLCERQGSWLENEDQESQLRDALRRAADTAGFSGDERLPYFTSATHQEIALGALARKDIDARELHPEDHVHVYVRRINGLPSDQTACDYIDWDNRRQIPVPGARARLLALLSELQDRLPENIREITAHWHEAGITKSHLDAFCEQFLTDQKLIIARELESREPLYTVIARTDQHAAFATERAQNFSGRHSILESIGNYLGLKGSTSPLIVYGEGGSGKSAVLAKAYLSAMASSQGRLDGVVPIVMCRFIGGVAGTDSLLALLSDLSADINAAYGRTIHETPSNLAAAREAFESALSSSALKRPLILFLDALDQINHEDYAWLLEWLPKTLCEHTRVVASSRPGQTLESAQRRFAKNLLPIPLMTPAEGNQMLDAWLADTRDTFYNAGITPGLGRRLTKEQRRLVLDKFHELGLPLWMKLAYAKVRSWPSWYGHDNPQSLNLPSSVEEMVRDLVLTQLQTHKKHPSVFTEKALAYLSAGRFGLSDHELDHALATDKAVRGELDRQNQKTGHHWLMKAKLPPILWSRLYFDLSPYLAQENVDGVLLHRWFHREFNEQVQKLYLSTEPQRRLIHGHLARCFHNLSPQTDDLFRYTDSSGEPQTAALRRVMEQPWHLARAGLRRELKLLIEDFGFCLAKSSRAEDLARDWSEDCLSSRTTSHKWGYARRWIGFIRECQPLLRWDRAFTSWPLARVFLQLALEEPDGSPVKESAMRWLEQFRPNWEIVIAPRDRPRGHSAQIRPPGGRKLDDMSIDRHGRIIAWFEDGAQEAFDPIDGQPLGSADVFEALASRDGRIPPLPVSRSGLIWPVGRGRWFCWQTAWEGGGGDGTASLYAPATETWQTLPQMHHEAVWFASELEEGTFATLGLNASKGVIVVWPAEGAPEAIRLDVFFPDRPELAGILALPDGSIVVWPALQNGEALRIKRDYGSLWWAFSLRGSAGIRKALTLDDSTFLTMSALGEIRTWQFGAGGDEMGYQFRSRVYPAQPGYKGPPVSGAERFTEDPSAFNWVPAPDLIAWGEDGYDSFWGSATLSLDGQMGVSPQWRSLLEASIGGSRARLLPRRWLAATESRIPEPAPDERDKTVWRRWLFQYLLEDDQRKLPHFSSDERQQLIRKALDMLEQLDPHDRTVGLLQAESMQYETDSWDGDRPPYPLRRLMDEHPDDEDLQMAWVSYCKIRGRKLAAKVCERLYALRPNSWRLCVRLARLIETSDHLRAIELRLEAMRILGMAANVRRIPAPGNFDLWEVYLRGRCSIWACERPGPAVFAKDGDQLIIGSDDAPLLEFMVRKRRIRRLEIVPR